MRELCPSVLRGERTRERNLQGLVTEPLSFPFLYVLGEKENPPNWQTPFNLDYARLSLAARRPPALISPARVISTSVLAIPFTSDQIACYDLTLPSRELHFQVLFSCKE